MSQALPATIVATHLERLRRTSPLTHVITNDVVTGFTANVLLALGAAPAMITAPEEAGAFAAMASALSVNVGTLTSTQAATIRIAVQAANQAECFVINRFHPGGELIRINRYFSLPAKQYGLIARCYIGNAGNISNGQIHGDTAQYLGALAANKDLCPA